MSTPTPSLAAPGSSIYDSNTVGLHVGDGTWDSSRDDFLLPNLVGFPFWVMRYNGMGNRFAGEPLYHHIVTGHGVMAAITFLFIVPAAIMIARFNNRNRRQAVRMHVWLQIITIFLATVVLILGWFAVGPARSLTNPHHGIGVAIYTLVLFQAIYGAWVRHHESKRNRDHVPMKLMLHQVLGRAIALLAIAQVALGLTLYGSPKVLFILYTLWVTFLLILYLILSYRNQHAFRMRDGGSVMYTDTNVTGPAGGGDQRPGFLGRVAPLLAAGGAGAALAAWAGRRNRRAQSTEQIDQRTEITEDSRRHSRPPSESFVDEKYTEDGRQQHTWRDRMLGAAAGVGVFEGARRLFGGRREDASDVGYQRPPHSTQATESDYRRVEEGRSPISPSAERIRRTEETTTVPVATASPSRRAALRVRRSGGSIHSIESAGFASPSRDKRRNYALRDGIAALGVAGYMRHLINQRKDRREEQRVSDVNEWDREEERVARMNSQRRRYTGDGAPRPMRRRSSISESDVTPIAGSNPALSRHDIRRNDVVSNPNVPQPPPFTHASPGGSPATADRHRLRDAAVPLAAGAAGAAIGAAVADHRASSRRRESIPEQGPTPPVSIKVRMQNDGRQVTLQRLDAAGAASDRQTRKLQRRRRNGSISSVSASGDERWRRAEAREAAQAAEMQQQQQQQQQQLQPGAPPPPRPPSPLQQQHNFVPGPPPGPAPVIGGSPLPPGALDNLPLPPPIPGSGLGGSPGSGGYDSSALTAGSRAESNRRRRRAERAKQEAERQQRGGNRVEFN